MKRKIVFFAVFLLVVATLPLILMKRGGAFWPAAEIDPGVISTEQTRKVFHKWQDSNGQWHFGEEVPEGVKAVAVEVDTAANIIQGVRAPSAPVADKKPVAEPTGPIPGIPMTVNPADIPAMMENARQLEKQLNQRQQQIEAVR